MTGGGADHDVIVAGDGPAAAAVVHACARYGLDVVAVGPTSTWANTYAMWRDEAPDLPDRCFAGTTARSVVRARSTRLVDRPYAVVDNCALRAHLGLDAVRRHGRVDRTTVTGDRAVVHLADGESLTARWVVDATGRPDADAWQTAYACVVSAADLERAGISTTDATVMAWLPDLSPPALLSAVPVLHGWRVAISALVARPAVDPQRLRRTLIGVLGDAPVVAAEALGRAETVWLPMGARQLPAPGGRIVPFGTAGALAHPATGHSVAAALVLSGRLAGALAAGDDPFAAVWTPAMRRTRELHVAVRDVLLRLDAGGLVDFFEAFHSIEPGLWCDFLRVDASDVRVAAAVRATFRAAPWSVRRRLLGVDRRLLLRALRGTAVGTAGAD